jgi:hypothetical protein
MDAAARDFIEDVRVDPWLALELPLPDDLDLAALQEVRPLDSCTRSTSRLTRRRR